MICFYQRLFETALREMCYVSTMLCIETLIFIFMCMRQDKRMDKILVTGGAGFIGSYLCRRLLDDVKGIYA